MSFASILVPVSGHPSSQRPLEAAVTLSRAHGGRLIGLGAEYAAPVEITPIMAPADVTGGLALAERKLVDLDIEAARGRFAAATAGMDPAAEWRESIEIPHSAILRNAASADLIVMGWTQPDTLDIYRHTSTGEMIIKAGVPVLSVPAGGMAREPRKIAIAWKNCREARRAVSDALPLLRRADEVIAYRVQEPGDDSEAAPCLRDLLNRLRRHGVKATGVTLPRTSSPGHDILAETVRCGVDLIVAGAYGRSRIQEWVFGGVTRTLLAEATVPVFFSH